MKNFIVVSHKYLPQPDDDIVFYLSNLEKKDNVLHIMHNFSDSQNRKSHYVWYQNGNKGKKESVDYGFLPDFFVLVKEFFFTLYWTVFSKKRWDLYIGMDGLCVCWGIMLKKIGVVKKVIFWSIDFVPKNRFEKPWKNLVYRGVNSYACTNSDEVWDLSPRMLSGRKKYLNLTKSNYRSHKVVPYGLWLDRIETVQYSRCEKKTLVFMGHLLPKQGVDTVIKTMPEIIKAIPDIKLKIIGDGRYKNNLVELTKKLNIEKYCDFLGRISSSEKVWQEIAKSAVAIAPYKKTNDNYTFYADPGKIKTYLACGVPLLLTDLSWNAKEIQSNNCGMIISDERTDLVVKLQNILLPTKNIEFRKNAINYSKSFNYKNIFAGLDL